MKLFSYIFINFEICYPKVINKEMWARVLPCVNVCVVFLHKCSLLCSFISFQFSSALLFSLPPLTFCCSAQHKYVQLLFFVFLTLRTTIEIHFMHISSFAHYLIKKKSVFSSKKRTLGVFLPNHYIR